VPTIEVGLKSVSVLTDGEVAGFTLLALPDVVRRRRERQEMAVSWSASFLSADSSLGGMAMDLIILAARILFAMLFASSGLFGHLGPGRPMLTAFAQARKIPSPGFVVPFAGAWIVVGGLSVLLGVYGDIGALMSLFVISTAVFMHPFWKEPNEQSKMQEQVHFNKDLGSPEAG
jgi:putative oxidoreductase